MRLIDADALKEKIEKYRIVHLSHRRLSAIKREAEEVIDDICFAIDVEPTIDPMKHGQWIENGYGNGEIVCSNCGEPCATFAMMKPRDRFCKWCGARMEGEEENE